MTQINYAVGNTSGRDHIYWPTITPAQLASLGYPLRPVGCSLEQIMALAWKVKTWMVSGSVAVQLRLVGTGVIDDDNGHFNYTITYTYNTAFSIPSFNMPLFKFQDNTPATDEKHILGGVGVSEQIGFVGLRNDGFSGAADQNVNETTSYSFVTVFVPPYPGPPPIPPSGSGSGTFSRHLQVLGRLFGGGPGVEYVVFNEGQFFPFIGMNCFLSPQYYTAFQFTPDPSGTPGAILTIDPGIASAFYVPLKVTANQGGFSMSVVSADVNLQMTATEFWGYA